MRKLTLTLAVLYALTVSLAAQTPTGSKTYQMSSIMMIKPKHGQEKAFEDGVKAHDSKYHTGPYSAQLWLITEGASSDGWYVWRMGPLTYTEMDKQPQGDKAHDDDWSKNVDANVDQYGETTFWKFQEDLSYTPANYNPDHLDVWLVDIKPGMRYQFSDLMKKWKAMWEAKKYPYSMRVSYSDLWNGNGADAAILFSFTRYAEFDEGSDWRKDYEELNGPGSWDNFWKEWNNCVVSTSEQLRKLVK